MSAFPGRRAVATVLGVCVFGLLVASGASSAKPHRALAGHVLQRERRARVVSGEPWTNPGQPPITRATELLAALSGDQKFSSRSATSPRCRAWACRP